MSASKVENGPQALSLEALATLPTAVGRPRYARSSLSPGIVHFGPGNFHRAHQGVYLDELMNAGKAHDWAVVGASVMPGDSRLRDTLRAQDMLGTVVSQSATDSVARVTGSLIDYLPVADSAAILGRLADPTTRIVSLTVTEGGYFVNADTGRFDAAHPAVVADAARFLKTGTPDTVFGLIVRALRARRDMSAEPFTVMSCDNLPHNGEVVRGAVVGFAELVDPMLAEWIAQAVTFPNGMVDRIAPATGERERRLVREQHGIADDAPVFCEDYLQWVLEDRFVAGRPAFEDVGVEFVSDVTPFETMKIRVLNGGHALIAYAGALLDIEFADEAMAHPLVPAFLDKVERDEILPTVPAVPNTDIEHYLARVCERFANPNIGDTTRRLCHDGSNRQPKFILPAVRDRLAAGEGVEGLALGSALWCRYCYGETDSGAAVAPNDPSWERLVAMAREARARPEAWLEMREVYGALGQEERFRSAFAGALQALWRDGVGVTLQQFVAG